MRARKRHRLCGVLRRLGDARPAHVPDGRAPQVVECEGNLRAAERSPPDRREVADVAALAVVEDQRRIEPALGKPTLEDRHQLRTLTTPEDAAAPRLRPGRLQPDRLRLVVVAVPGQRKDLALAHPRAVGERRHIAQHLRRQLGQQRVELGPFDEPLGN